MKYFHERIVLYYTNTKKKKYQKKNFHSQKNHKKNYKRKSFHNVNAKIFFKDYS